MNLKIIFRTSIELQHVHLSAIELEHPIFGLERSNIEPNRDFTRFIKFLNEQTQTSVFRTSNELERVRLFGNQTQTPYFLVPTIEHRTLNKVQPINNRLLEHWFFLNQMEITISYSAS